MTQMEKLIKVLADGEFHSGEDLGHVIGVTRAAVWKQLQKLTDLGLLVESVKGKGYRLPGGLDLLDAKAIQQLLKPGGISHTSIHYFESLDSTNAEVLRRMAVGESTGCVVLAEMQTAGRGRRGREWLSPYGCNIYLSVGWRFQGGVQALQGLTLALGVEAVRALEDAGVKDIKLKWPNDLLYAGRKVGGILVEVEGDLAGECHCAIGLGLNLGMSLRSTGESIDQPWVDLMQIAERPIRRNPLVAHILMHWLPLIEQYEQTGFSNYQMSWQAMDNYANQPVSVLLGPKTVRGISRGVDEEGNLLLESDGAIKTFAGGEISLRPTEAHSRQSE